MNLTRLLEKYDSSITFPFNNAANVREYLIVCNLAYQISPDYTTFRKNKLKKNRTTYEMKNPSIFSSTNWPSTVRQRTTGRVILIDRREIIPVGFDDWKWTAAQAQTDCSHSRVMWHSFPKIKNCRADQIICYFACMNRNDVVILSRIQRLEIICNFLNAILKRYFTMTKLKLRFSQNDFIDYLS